MWWGGELPNVPNQQFSNPSPLLFGRDETVTHTLERTVLLKRYAPPVLGVHWEHCTASDAFATNNKGCAQSALSINPNLHVGTLNMWLSYCRTSLMFYYYLYTFIKVKIGNMMLSRRRKATVYYSLYFVSKPLYVSLMVIILLFSTNY